MVFGRKQIFVDEWNIIFCAYAHWKLGGYDIPCGKSAERGRLYFVRRHQNLGISPEALRDFKTVEIVSSSQ